jgi:microcystin-dependent protein
MSFLSDRRIQDSLPAGVVFPFAGASAPDGWLLCDGSAISRTTYARLFASIGTSFGVGDGSSTFNLPNTQGVFIRGAGSQTISAINYSGVVGTVQGDQVQGHYHSKSESAHTHAAAGETSARAVGANTGWGIAAGQTNAAAGVQGATSNVSITSPSSDGTNGTPRTGSQTHPANLGMNHIIKI